MCHSTECNVGSIIALIVQHNQWYCVINKIIISCIRYDMSSCKTTHMSSILTIKIASNNKSFTTILYHTWIISSGCSDVYGYDCESFRLVSEDP